MYHFYELLSGSPPQVARASFGAVESNRGKREMLMAVGRAVLPATEANILEDILRRVGKSATQRNKYVHDTWGVAQTQKHEIFQVRFSDKDGAGTMEEVRVNDLETARQQIRKLASELDALKNRSAPSVPTSLQKLRERPGIGLVYRPKGHPPGRLPKGHRGQQKS